MKEGRIIKGIGGFYYVDYNHDIYECKARGILRKNKKTPMVGDQVRFSILDPEKKLGILEDILERKNELIRPPVANVDQAVVVFAITQPEPNLSLLDRFLVLAESQQLDIVICFNKIDLLQKDDYLWMVDIYKNAGYPVLLTSKENNDGINKLKEILAGRVTVFAGPSGVGKSTLLNRIQSNIKLQTGEISVKSERGKHTTRHVELIPLNQRGWVVDTPGFSSLKVDFMEEIDLAYYFPEILQSKGECKFNSCLHENEPSCLVKKRVEEKEIAAERYESYKKLLEEIRLNRRY
ncbi:ribosome small subunit-dependent GTPase A [Alkaliphilus peptidifermentans]|uniref:Small ribosomal subunit biogenesis GTPase RsgA n=1 Tax=Alkaliphilus peptidifermentans DSM 18978 TaxID=1120976 RepID=A0A1G5JAS4_9FIRM|nr:ribosome small subunit-dependent GTPase A [Alkaliphilus peptidifermentans]SCY85294.1 ribosome biogenesis GTPase [Alkaliphilus peptidifermentans DSM 18978]